MRQLLIPGAEFNNRSVKSVTFQGKLRLPIHRWYRLTPSFSPELANDIADYFELGTRDFVLDPFSGVGTVPLCMKYRGIPACSIELNPFLHFVSTVKTRTYIDLDPIDSCFSSFSKLYKDEVARLPHDPAAYLEKEAQHVPQIQYPERWWSPSNLMQLTCLRKLLLCYDAEPMCRDLLKMGASSILVTVSNAKHNHVSLTFASEPLPTVDISKMLSDKFKEMLEDLRAVAAAPCAEVTIYKGNSKDVASVLPNRKISAVITSPPYPNRFSYARETRPHLFFNTLVENAASVGQLEIDAIGGTWGKATSVLSKGIEPANKVIQSLLAPYVGHIYGKGELMVHYVTKYFNNIYEHAEGIAKICSNRARLAYVIGNSKFYDHPLPSDEILAEIFVQFGFQLDRIDRMRKRQSKTALYEAVVFLRRD